MDHSGLIVFAAIGSLVLGDLPKGHWRKLDEDEIAALFSNVDVKD